MDREKLRADMKSYILNDLGWRITQSASFDSLTDWFMAYNSGQGEKAIKGIIDLLDRTQEAIGQAHQNYDESLAERMEQDIKADAFDQLESVIVDNVMDD